MTKNIFINRFKTKTKSELLQILDNREKYTSEAIEAAGIILKAKGYEQSEIQQIKIKEENQTILKNETKDLIFHSRKAIGITTFLGGPLAASYLIRENYLQLNEPDKAKNSILIGVLVTFSIILAFFLISENIVDKLPKYLTPLILLAIVYLILGRVQGKILKSHEDSGNEFHSYLTAIFVGLTSAAIIFLSSFGLVYFSETNHPINKRLVEFQNNEIETVAIYDRFGTDSDDEIMKELERKTIPKWKENIEILNSAKLLNDLTPEMIYDIEIRLEYSKLRLRAFELIKTSISLGTDVFKTELDRIHRDIDKQLELINNN